MPNSFGNQMLNATKKKVRQRLKFLPEEDEKLKNLVEKYGTNSWSQVATKMPGRNVRQCRERWKHYLSVDKTYQNPFTPEEDQIIVEKFFELGPKWTKISKFLQGRSDIQIKSRLQKTLKIMNSFLPNRMHFPFNHYPTQTVPPLHGQIPSNTTHQKQQEINETRISLNENLDNPNAVQQNQPNEIDLNTISNPIKESIPNFKLCGLFDSDDTQPTTFQNDNIHAENIFQNFDFELFYQ